MNNEVESYRNDELVSILNAFPDRTKILINGSADFEVRYNRNGGEPYINIVAKEKTVIAGTRKRSKSNTD